MLTRKFYNLFAENDAIRVCTSRILIGILIGIRIGILVGILVGILIGILIRILIRILLGILMTNSIDFFLEFSSEILFKLRNSGLKSNWLHLIGLGMAGGLFGASWTPALRGCKIILPK